MDGMVKSFFYKKKKGYGNLVNVLLTDIGVWLKIFEVKLLGDCRFNIDEDNSVNILKEKTFFREISYL